MYRRQHIIVAIDIPQLLSVLLVYLFPLMPLSHNHEHTYSDAAIVVSLASSEEQASTLYF